MAHLFVFIMTMLVVGAAESHGSLTSEVYWRSMLPNSPMPKAIREHLSSGAKLQEPVTIHDVKQPYGVFAWLAGEKKDRKGGDPVVTGPEGNPVTIHDVKQPYGVFAWLAGEKKDRKGDDPVVTGPEGNPVTIHDVKQPYGVFAWLAGEKTDRKGGDPVVTGPEGNPVTIHDVKQPYGVFAWLAGEKKDRKGGDPIITGPGGNPVTIHDVKQPYSVFSWLAGEKKDQTTEKDADQSTAFLEKDLRVGATFDVIFKRPIEGDHFLSRRAADSIPFSYVKLPEILDLFSIAPHSFEAEKMEEVLRACERAPLPGMKKHCATSLESMLDFVTSNLKATSKHTVIKALSPTPEKETPSMQAHTVASFSAAATEATMSVVCHLQEYPYTVYHCHTDPSTLPYIVRLIRESDGSTVEAAAMCHRDTSNWDPEFRGLRKLKVRPGGAPVCHILPVGDIVFFPTSAAAVVPGNDHIAVQ